MEIKVLVAYASTHGSTQEVAEVVADPGNDQVTVESGSVNEDHIKATVERLGYIFRGRK